MKKALIIGITGQDGSFLSELLLGKGYEVYGIIRRSSTPNTLRLENILNNKNLHLKYGDLTDSSSIINAINRIEPDEIYNLGAQSDVKVSFDVPEYTTDVNAVGTLRILEAIHILKMEKRVRLYQSSTSELFGETNIVPQNEETEFKPVSPYGIAKLYAYNMCELYKKAYGMFICNGILFNHESERRGEEFVTRKITKQLSRIALGKKETLKLGNMHALRDWGYAKDYVELMWKMLQQKEPDNYVIATGKQFSVKDFCNMALEELEIKVKWMGEGKEEKAINTKTGETIIEVDEKYYRPVDVNNLLGNPSKAIKNLGYNPNKTPIDKLIKIMIAEDLKIEKRKINEEK